MISDDRLNINLSQNKMSFLELHHILEETNRKKYKNKPQAPRKIVDDDYDELQEENSFEEETDVRELEKWHLEMKKRNSKICIFSKISCPTKRKKWHLQKPKQKRPHSQFIRANS